MTLTSFAARRPDHFALGMDGRNRFRQLVGESADHLFLLDIQQGEELAIFPELFTETLDKIPQQRSMVNRLLTEGKILNYALSLENSKLWVVFAASSEAELMEMVHRLPLTRYMKVRVNELTFYNSVNTFVPAFSVN